MIKHSTQKLKCRQHSVTRERSVDKIRQVNFNLLLRPAQFYSKNSNKANKMVENICTYVIMFLETSSIHGLKYLTPKNRATSER
jgi:endonuclease III-like uncharacterized protein